MASRAERVEEAARALVAVVDGRDRGLRGYYIDAARFEDLRDALAAQPAQASDNPRPVCRCGCQDKMHDAGEIGSRRCNQPGCPCSDFAPAAPARAGLSEAYGREIAEREARGEVAVDGRWVKPAQAGEAVAWGVRRVRTGIIVAAEITKDAAVERASDLTRTLQEEFSTDGHGIPLYAAPSRPGGA